MGKITEISRQLPSNEQENCVKCQILKKENEKLKKELKRTRQLLEFLTDFVSRGTKH
jgi:hypothetical protein